MRLSRSTAQLIGRIFFHFNEFRDAAMAELFRDMAREDQKHFETLDSYYGDKKKPSHYPYH